MLANPRFVVCYPRLVLAEQAIGVINRAMHRGYEVLIARREGVKDSLPEESKQKTRIGLDESGKSDYFGPLVVSAVYVDEQVEHILMELGVRDSKKVKNEQHILAMAETIQKHCFYAIVCIESCQYQGLY